MITAYPAQTGTVDVICNHCAARDRMIIVDIAMMPMLQRLMLCITCAAILRGALTSAIDQLNSSKRIK